MWSWNTHSCWKMSLQRFSHNFCGNIRCGFVKDCQKKTVQTLAEYLSYSRRFFWCFCGMKKALKIGLDRMEKKSLEIYCAAIKSQLIVWWWTRTNVHRPKGRSLHSEKHETQGWKNYDLGLFFLVQCLSDISYLGHYG